MLRDIFKLSNVDVGGGWLIFGLPPAEVAVHPSDENDRHELYLMCEDIEAFATTMREQEIACGPVTNEDWGMLTHIQLPGGGKLGVYQPRHPRPKATAARATRSAKAKSPKRPPKPARKTKAKKKGR